MSPGPGGTSGNLPPTVVTTKRRPVAPRTPARKSSLGGAHSAPRRRSGAAARAPRRAPSILRRHAADLWSIGLITLGVLLALAIWGDALGPVGHGINVGLATVVGWTRILIPLIAVGAGVVLLVERERPEPVRTCLGAALGIVGFCGLGQLAKSNPPFSPSVNLQQAGGWVGALVGRPLHAGIGSAGSGVLFVVVVFVAGLIATGVSLATFGRIVGNGASAVGSTLASWWNSGVTHGRRDRRGRRAGRQGQARQGRAGAASA